MSPEFGSTCAIFPIDAETLRYLAFTGRPKELIDLVEAYAKEQGLWHDENAEEPTYSDTVELDLGDVVPSLAGPKRPQDRVALHGAKDSFRAALADLVGRDAEEGVANSHDEAVAETFPASDPPADNAPGHDPPAAPASAPAVAAGTVIAEHSDTAVEVTMDGETFKVDHGHVVIAAITSCTNTSNPSVMLGAGLLARNAVARGLTQPAVGQDVAGAGLQGGDRVPRPRRAHRAAGAARLQPRRLRLHDVHRQLRARCPTRSAPRSTRRDLAVCSVLSGNRNFEGRINPDVKMNYLASPPLVVAYAIAGHDGPRPRRRPARGRRRRPGGLPQGPLALRPRRSRRPSRRPCSPTCSARATARSSTATSAGTASRCPTGDRFAWDEQSTYVRQPPYFEGLPPEPTPVEDVEGARVLAKLGDSRHHRPHLARRLDQGGQPRRRATSRSTASRGATSTPTARGAATTR